VNSERVSIILQIFSFVLVTTDLLGKDRIASLNGQAEKWLTGAQGFSIWDALDQYLSAFSLASTRQMIVFFLWQS
jgi:hypothetical protein